MAAGRAVSPHQTGRARPRLKRDASLRAPSRLASGCCVSSGSALPLGSCGSPCAASIWPRSGLGCAHLQPAQLLLLALFNLVVLATFSARWWLLLYGQGYALPYFTLMGYRLAAFAVSYFTPGPHFGGEPLQVYLVTARNGVPVANSLAAVVLDKTLEMLANFTFLALGVLFVLGQEQLLGVDQGRLLVYAGALLLLPASLLAALAAGRHPLSGLLDWGNRAWLRLTGRQGAAADRLTQSRSYQTLRQSEAASETLFRRRPWLLVAAAGASILSWLGIVGEFWYMTSVLGLELTLAEAILMLLAARVAILLPLPAGLGALEGSLALAAVTLGLSPADGVSLSILIRVRDVLLGVVGLWLAWMLIWRGKPRK